MMTDTNDLSDGATINLGAACAAVCLRCKQGGNRPLRIDGIWVHPFPAVVGCEVCGANALRNLPSTEATHDARLRRALKRCGHRLIRAHTTLQQLGERLRKCRSGVGAPTEWWRERWQEWTDWARVELEWVGITEPPLTQWGSCAQRGRLSALLRELKGGGLNSEVESLRGALPIVRAAIAVRRHAGNIRTAVAETLTKQSDYLIRRLYHIGRESGPVFVARWAANIQSWHVTREDTNAFYGWHSDVWLRKNYVRVEPPAPRCDTCLHYNLNHDCAPWCTLYGVGVAPRYGWSCRGYERRSGKLVRDHDGKETER